MKASPTQQRDLLHIQDLDVRAARLTRQASRLPQAAALTENATRERVARQGQAERSGVLDEARARLGRIEADVAVVVARATRDAERLTQSASMKDISALEADLAALQRRQSALEDQQLEAMMAVEDAEAAMATAEHAHAQITAERDRLTVERDRAAAEIEESLAAVAQEREAGAAALEPSLLADYERRRGRGAGIGAALLRQRTCSGCTIALTGSALAAARAAAADEVMACPECDCILVRTEESGL